MSLQELFGNFDDLIRTPEDVARLDAVILDLAVTGRMVNQDADDLSSSLAMENLPSYINYKTDEKNKASEKNQQTIGGFTLPFGWRLCRSQDVCASITDGDHIPPPKSETGVPFLVISNIRDGKIDLSQTRYVPRDYYHGLQAIRKPRIGDVLCSIVGSIGTSVLIEEEVEFCFQRHLALFRPNQSLVPKFLLYVLRAPSILNQMRMCATGIAQLTVPLSCLRNLTFPLPPLAEQHRIVAKVDELLAQTRALAANLRRAQDEVVVVNQAALHHLQTAADAESLQTAWHTVAGSFDLLYDDLRPLVALRQTILQLAISGRLVRQDASDEPASELVARLKDQNGYHGTGAVPGVDLYPHLLPNSWLWLRFGSVAQIATNSVDPNLFGDLPHIAPDNIEKFTGRLLNFRTIREDAVTSVKHRFFPGQILYSKIRPNLSKVVMVDFEGLCSADMYPIFPLILRRYLHIYMLSDTFRGFTTHDDTRVAMPKINQDALTKIPVPVPPLPEQHRIVAKVDELFSLCDTLEHKLTQSALTRRAAVESVLAHVLRG
jgi:type I restriction enzyme S subunit